ncbi:MAG: TIR domain-containing protein [Anaerolineaceae bacterium]|nr:TIR domain-containing protein [Anaerolineaceae bacterium]
MNQIFISHASDDIKLVKLLERKLKSIFANGVGVFASSIPGSIRYGEDWFASIRSHLTDSSVLLLLITPHSVDRPWVWFELGASWDKNTEGKIRAIPLCCGIKLRDLPPPISAIQGVELSNQEQVEQFFHELMTFFKFGDEKRVQAKKFIEQMNDTASCDDTQTFSKVVTSSQLTLMIELLITKKTLTEDGLDIVSGFGSIPTPKIAELRKLFYKK